MGLYISESQCFGMLHLCTLELWTLDHVHSMGIYIFILKSTEINFWLAVKLNFEPLQIVLHGFGNCVRMFKYRYPCIFDVLIVKQMLNFILWGSEQYLKLSSIHLLMLCLKYNFYHLKSINYWHEISWDSSLVKHTLHSEIQNVHLNVQKCVQCITLVIAFD